MATKSATIAIVGAVPPTTVLATAPKHHKIVPTGIKFHGDGTARVVTVTDAFTTDAAVNASTGAAVASGAKTPQMLKIHTKVNEDVDLKETELKDCKFLGAATFQASAGVIVVTMSYHLE